MTRDEVWTLYRMQENAANTTRYVFDGIDEDGDQVITSDQEDMIVDSLAGVITYVLKEVD